MRIINKFSSFVKKVYDFFIPNKEIKDIRNALRQYWTDYFNKHELFSFQNAEINDNKARLTLGFRKQRKDNQSSPSHPSSWLNYLPNTYKNLADSFRNLESYVGNIIQELEGKTSDINYSGIEDYLKGGALRVNL